MNVVALIGGEPDGGATDLLGLADAFLRDEGEEGSVSDSMPSFASRVAAGRVGPRAGVQGPVQFAVHEPAERRDDRDEQHEAADGQPRAVFSMMSPAVITPNPTNNPAHAPAVTVVITANRIRPSADRPKARESGVRTPLAKRFTAQTQKA